MIVLQCDFTYGTIRIPRVLLVSKLHFAFAQHRKGTREGSFLTTAVASFSLFFHMGPAFLSSPHSCYCSHKAHYNEPSPSPSSSSPTTILLSSFFFGVLNLFYLKNRRIIGEEPRMCMWSPRNGQHLVLAFHSEGKDNDCLFFSSPTP